MKDIYTCFLQIGRQKAVPVSYISYIYKWVVCLMPPINIYVTQVSFAIQNFVSGHLLKALNNQLLRVIF